MAPISLSLSLPPSGSLAGVYGMWVMGLLMVCEWVQQRFLLIYMSFMAQSEPQQQQWRKKQNWTRSAFWIFWKTRQSGAFKRHKLCKKKKTKYIIKAKKHLLKKRLPRFSRQPELSRVQIPLRCTRAWRAKRHQTRVGFINYISSSCCSCSFGPFVSLSATETQFPADAEDAAKWNTPRQLATLAEWQMATLTLAETAAAQDEAGTKTKTPKRCRYFTLISKNKNTYFSIKESYSSNLLDLL